MNTVFRPLVISTLIAAVINQVAYFVAVEFFGVAFVLATADSASIPLMTPALLTVSGGIIGGFMGAAIASRTGSPKNVWLSITLVALALSFVLPLLGIESQPAALWLNGMHVVAGALIIPMVRQALPSAKATPED